MAALFAAPEPLLAQEIVVTGTGLGGGAGDIAYDVVTIDRGRLTGSASGRIEDILRDVAGFQQFRRSDSRSAHPTSQGATLRGIGGNASSRALILLDGVPQVDPFGGWVSWSAFDPARLGLVRVTRGGGSGAFGPGALAGTIELSSATPDDLSPVWGALAYGSRDSIDADLGLSAQLGEGFGLISAGYQRGDGFVPIVEGVRGAADRAAPYEQGSVSARAVLPVGEDTELQASGLVVFDERDRGTDFSENRNLGADASIRLVRRGDWTWEAAAWLQMRQFSSQFASVPAARNTASLTLDQYNVPATGLGGRFELRPPLGDRIQLRIGADSRQTAGRTKERYFFTAGVPANRREAGGRTRTLGGFADLSIDMSDALTLTGGARIDRWWIDNGFLDQRSLSTGEQLADSTVFADRSGWEPTGRAGIAWRPNNAVTVRGAGYLGWRLPTLNELFRPFRVGAETTRPNPRLAPERLKGIDGGIDFQPLPTARLSLTLFWNELDDAISNVTIGTNLRQRQNVERLRARGLEVDGEARIGAWTASASYAFVDARIAAKGAAAALDGLRPAQTPRHHASATLGWGRAGAVRLALTGRYAAPQFDDDQNERRLDDAVTFDAFTSIPVASGWSFEARGENLANARVETTRTGRQDLPDLVERATPRTLWIGLRYER